MNDKEMTDLLKKQLDSLERAGVDMAGDKQFFYVGEWELALEGVYVANKRHPGVLVPEEVQALVDDFGVDMSELDG